MSTPCTYPHHDWLVYLLYTGDARFLAQVVAGCVANIRAAHASEGVRAAAAAFAPGPGDGLHALRARLLVLLDLDEATRRRLCEFRSELVRDWLPACPHKASRFYAALHDELLPAWVKDETVTAEELVDRARMAYLIS